MCDRGREGRVDDDREGEEGRGGGEGEGGWGTCQRNTRAQIATMLMKHRAAMWVYCNMRMSLSFL